LKSGPYPRYTLTGYYLVGGAAVGDKRGQASQRNREVGKNAANEYEGRNEGGIGVLSADLEDRI